MSQTKRGVMVATLGTLLVVAYSLLARTPSPRPAPLAPAEQPVVKTPDPPSPDGAPATYVGLVLPAESVDIRSTAEGELVELRVRTGDRVRSETILAVLDTAVVARGDLTLAELDLRVAESEVQRLTIELEQAGTRRARALLLTQQSLLSQEQLQDAEYLERATAMRLQTAGYVKAQKQTILEQRKLIIANAEIRAPFDGVVSIQHAHKGDAISKMTPLVRLVRTSSLRLRFAIPGNLFSMIVIGAPIIATVTDLGVTLPGVVDGLAPEVDSASQMVMVEVALTPPPGAGAGLTGILAGRSATVSFVPSARK